MIITINGNQYNIDILRNFKPVYKRGIKYKKLLNGTYYFSDREGTADKHETTITIIGDNSDIETIANELSSNTTQVTINTGGLKILGPAISHSSSLLFNVIGSSYVYPRRDKITSYIELRLRCVSKISYAVAPALPSFVYDYGIDRIVSQNSNTFDSIGSHYDFVAHDYGKVTLANTDQGANTPLNSQTVSFNMTLKEDDMAGLQTFVYTTGADSFSISTTSALYLFLNSLTNDVKILSFTFEPDGPVFWKCSMTLLKV
jgi:hypothetical protein